MAILGPGRAASSPAGDELHTSKHVAYIKNLDTVRALEHILDKQHLIID
jgi:hypothetical protein